MLNPECYYDGVPCSRNPDHGTLRAKANRICVECLRERRRIRDKRKYDTNPEEILARNRAYYRRNPEKRKASNANWKQQNPEDFKRIWNESKRRRMFRLRGAAGTYSAAEMAAFLTTNTCCVYCASVDDLTIDHKLPITRGGTNMVDNFQRACRSCNSRKGSKTHEEYVTWLNS